jgi:hypothetical protein
MVSWTVAMVAKPPGWVSCLASSLSAGFFRVLPPGVGASRMRALEVFFWRRE